MSNPPPPWLAPFVVDTPALEPEPHDTWNLYVPASDPPATGRPLVVLVHGGPIPPNLPHLPREWPVYRGYAALLAAAGTAAVVVGHPLHAMDGYASAHAVVARAVEDAREDDRVDSSRVAVWLFSGAGPMAAQWLAAPPWLRCLAMTYPVLDDAPGRVLPDGFRPIEALAKNTAQLPLVLTRVGREAPPVAAGVDRFVAEANRVGVTLQVLDVPDGVHGYDMDEPTRQSQDAVRASIDRVTRALH